MSAHLPAGGAPFSFSMRRTVSRRPRNSSAFAPMTLRAMIEDEAWPSAQAFTTWEKSVTVSPSILRSIVTVEPSQARDVPGQLQNSAVVDLVQHGVQKRLFGRVVRSAMRLRGRGEAIYR